MMLAWTLGMALLPAMQADTKRVTIEAVGLELDCPTAWKVEKTKTGTTFEFKLASGENARVEIYGAVFSEPMDHWELVQGQMAKQLNQEVLRQWREEILGVPLLLAKLRMQGSVSYTVFTGMMYARVTRKMVFRAMSTSDQAADLEFVWRKALETVRTLDGEKLDVETPGRVIDPKAVKAPVVKPPKRVTVSSEAKPETKVNPNLMSSETMSAGGKTVILKFPKAWTAKKTESGSIELSNAKLAGVVTIVANSTLDSEPAERALIKASTRALDRYTKVEMREEKAGIPNAFGAATSFVWRRGITEKGALSTIQGVGHLGDLYWQLEFETSNPDGKDSYFSLIHDLMKLLVLESQP